MAASSSSRQVIAQLSQGRNHNSNSVTGSPSPQRPLYDDNSGTVSSFAPDHESTQQFDTATQSPNLRSSARRLGHYIPAEPAIQIDMSLERPGFPDFTAQSPSSDHSHSIELGRGVKRNARNSPNRYLDDYEISENLILSLGDDSLYELTGTPPISSRARGHNSLRKEASVRRAATAPPADVTKTSDIVPNKTRSTSNSKRRTLSDMHAKVHAESDSSLVMELYADAARPAKDRNTRFSQPRQASTGENAIPTRFTPGKGLTSGNNQTPRRQQTAMTDEAANFTGNQTHQSFLLPDLPNITELVSGVRKDGTPVFSRTSKSKSRFTSASYGKGQNGYTTSHARLQSIPLPEEEKAIISSLQLLKDKVGQLELEKSEASKRIEEYENEVIDLRSQLQAEQKFRRPDSALGSDEESSGRDKWRVERSNLQASVKALQDRLDKSERKVSVSEIAVKRMTNERDNLVTQLGVAFYSNEELKDENAELVDGKEKLQRENNELNDELHNVRRQNKELRVQSAQSQTQHETETLQWAKRQNELKGRIERREETVREMRDITREIWAGQKSKDTEKTSGAQGKTKKLSNQERGSSDGHVGLGNRSNLMDKVEREIKKARKAAADKAATANGSQDARIGSRSRSKSAVSWH